jgi:hypothetical protein
MDEVLNYPQGWQNLRLNARETIEATLRPQAMFTGSSRLVIELIFPVMIW